MKKDEKTMQAQRKREKFLDWILSIELKDIF